jgi:type III secretion protein C
MPKPLRSWLVAAVLALAGLLQPAAAVEWRKGLFRYAATQQPMSQVLRDFAENQGLDAVVDKRIDELADVRFAHAPPDVLRVLKETHGISTFADGRVLHFFRSADIVSRMVRLRTVTMDRARNTLRRLGVEDRRFPLVFDDAERLVVIQGPKDYVDTVAAAVGTLDDQRPDNAQAEEIRVFPLRFAWAQDKSVQNGTQTHALPGVASLLRRLFQGQRDAAPPANDMDPAAAARAKLPAGRTIHSPVFGTVEVPPSFEESTRRLREDRSGIFGPAGAQRSALPQIEADAQLNAVIIRDHAYRMDSYGRLIAALDVKPLRVEIEARIIDVEASSLHKLGVRWQGKLNRLSAGFEGTAADPAESLPGAFATTLIGTARNSLLVSINALEQAGSARILAEPKVLTLNNVEAALSNTETYYVKVAGNLSAELFNVTAGTRLRVTPLVSTEPDGARLVKLAITAQDGDFSDASVERLPIVKNRDLATQAFVRDGESLLVGGMAYERDISSTAGVPVLAQMPVVGRLFQHREQNKVRVERLFLITPRIVDDVPADAAARAAAQAR